MVAICSHLVACHKNLLTKRFPPIGLGDSIVHLLAKSQSGLNVTANRTSKAKAVTRNAHTLGIKLFFTVPVTS